MAPGYSKEVERRIAESVEMVREVSMQTDPQAMVQRFRERMGRFLPRDASVSLSRRDLRYPCYRITRSSRWTEEIDPWKQPDRLPVLKGGLLAELIYANEPRLIGDLSIDPDEPARAYLAGMRSLVSLPLYDRGESLNMIVRLMREPNAFDPASLPDLIIMSNLFGRATNNLVTAERLREAYEALDAEFAVVAEIQQSLLPACMPPVAGLETAAYYATARRAGGDYYDVFPLDRGRTGILIADVSGHGAAAAVVMARMHAALHARPSVLGDPASTLQFANEQLLQQCRCDRDILTFVTAFYGVFDAPTRTMTYASAGHNPPRRRGADGCISSVAGARQMPLAIECGLSFEQDRLSLAEGDELLLYTDGIIEAADSGREMFGVDRLDAAFLQPHDSVHDVIANIVHAVDAFTEHAPRVDDRTLLALRVGRDA